MRTDYELTINYPFELMSPAHDEMFTNAVGRDFFVASGAGPLTGGRDLNFSFDMQEEAEAALERVKALGKFRYRWSIIRWEWDDGDDVNDSTLITEGEST